MSRRSRDASKPGCAPCGAAGVKTERGTNDKVEVACPEGRGCVTSCLYCLGYGTAGISGMVLRRSDIEDAPAYEPPQSSTERRLAEIWQESIGIDSVGINDDFFLVCGSSLVAAIIFSKIQKLLGVKLPLSLLV